jgi:S-formylglutathione hydrolase FrmB
VRHFISALSLTHGWVPTLLQLLTALIVLGAIGWRSRTWRLFALPALAVAGVLLAVCAHIYLGSLGIAGDPAPWGVWIWIGIAGLAFGVVVVGWRGARWWRRGMSLVAVPLSLLCAALAVNLWVGYFPTVHAAWNQLTAGPLPDQTDRLTVTEMQLAGTRPKRGVVVPVSINSDASGFRHRRELVYLPPAWFATTPPPRLPAVMMIASALNTPADWLRAGNAVQTVDDYASAHDGYAPVLVFVDATGAFDNDTECVNGNRGNAEDHLIKDVVPFVISNFAVSDQRSHWGVVGWSMGGTCAVDLTVMHPDRFSAFVDVAGDLGPNTGTRDQTIARLFGGNADAWAAYDPVTVMKRHGPYTGVWGRFDIPGAAPSQPFGTDPVDNPEGQDTAAHSLCRLGRTYGIGCRVVTQPGRHDWPFAAAAFATELPWLAAQLGTPETLDAK